MTLQKEVRSKSAQDLRNVKVIAGNYELRKDQGLKDFSCRNVSTSSGGRPFSPSPQCWIGTKLATISGPPLSLPSITLNIRSQNVTHCRENTNRQSSTGGLSFSPASRGPGLSRRTSSGGWRPSGAGCRSSRRLRSLPWSAQCSLYWELLSFTTSPLSYPSIIQAGSNVHQSGVMSKDRGKGLWGYQILLLSIRNKTSIPRFASPVPRGLL